MRPEFELAFFIAVVTSLSVFDKNLVFKKLIGKVSNLFSFYSFSDALFRQLCVLLWLLEATNTESIYSMMPIHTCWKLE